MGTIKALSALAAISLAGSVAAQIFELQKAFDKDANPHGGWSFGFGKTPTSFELFKDNRQVGELYASRGQSDLKGWSRPEGIFPYVACNLGKEIYYQRWRPEDVVLHPSADLCSVARWTNPGAAATIRIYATFRRVENVTDNTPQWYVVVNGVVVDSGDLLLGDEEKSVTEVVEIRPKDTVAVVVGCKNHRPDGTDLSVRVTIKATPH
jgi:hypothetical protein